jgi:tetratricopeptide (TPR) repeat protein
LLSQQTDKSTARSRPVAFFYRHFFWLSLLAAVLSAAPASAQINEAALRAFEQGNDHYRSERYGDALTAYRKADSAGLTGAALHFNRGNALYRMDRIGPARLAYERAARLRPDDPRIRHNIEQLRQRLAETIPEQPDPFWTRWWQLARSQWSALQFFLVGAALYLGGLGLFGFGLFESQRRRWRRLLAIALTGGAILLFGAAFLASWQTIHPRQAVVMAQETSLRVRPGSSSERTRKLHEGVLLRVANHDSTWTRVRLPNGETGWLPSSALERV